MSDAQWAAIEPVLPPAASQIGPGRPEAHARRLILDAVFYLVAEGIR
jgi:transposase